MDALPLVAKAALAAVLVASIAFAFRGPPPRRPHMRLAVTLVGIAVASYVVAVEALLTGSAVHAGVMVTVGVEALCAAGWLLREEPGGGESRGDDDGGPGPEPPPVDWQEFDRARAGWRPREPAT